MQYADALLFLYTKSKVKHIYELVGIITLKETADRLLAHAKAAVNDITKVESLLTVKGDSDSAVLDCNHRFLDYKESLS